MPGQPLRLSEPFGKLITMLLPIDWSQFLVHLKVRVLDDMKSRRSPQGPTIPRKKA